MQNTWKAHYPASFFKKKKGSALQCYSLVGVYNLSASKDKIKEFICENPKTKMFHCLPRILADQYHKFKETCKRYFFYSGCHISDK